MRMQTKHVLIDLLNYLEEYEHKQVESGQQLTTSNFIAYLHSVHYAEINEKLYIRGGDEVTEVQQFSENRTATNVSILVSLLFRYAKMYTRKALKDSSIRTVDEFALLITLLTHESISKQELIREQVLEKTSGIEIINRLIRRDYIQQFAGAKDRRSKLLKITEKGIGELMQVLPVMNKVSQLIVGNLTVSEQNLLLSLMRKLDHFHNDIYQHEKDATLDQILTKVNPSE
jgi:DNA-binding MarR family transcriptional regulator